MVLKVNKVLWDLKEVQVPKELREIRDLLGQLVSQDLKDSKVLQEVLEWLVHKANKAQLALLVFKDQKVHKEIKDRVVIQVALAQQDWQDHRDQ